jgi:hypothetical protein
MRRSWPMSSSLTWFTPKGGPTRRRRAGDFCLYASYYCAGARYTLV